VERNLRPREGEKGVIIIIIIILLKKGERKKRSISEHEDFFILAYNFEGFNSGT
jgi:hypothetical protein